MTSKEVSQGGPEPYFLPAASCSVLANVGFIAGVTLGNFEIVFVSCLLWGAGIAFWEASGRAGGGTPWPKSRKEFVEMVNSCGRTNQNINQ